eukprot:Selendium_serpulae@DN6516_c2_g6_i1.p1
MTMELPPPFPSQQMRTVMKFLIFIAFVCSFGALNVVGGTGTHLRRSNLSDRMKSFAEGFVLAPDDPPPDEAPASSGGPPDAWAAAIGRQNCTSYYRHANWGDGFGHQLTDIFSLMVYHLVNDEGACFVANRKYRYFFPYPPIGHNCKTCVYMFNQLMGGWPSETNVPSGVEVERRQTHWGKI